MNNLKKFEEFNWFGKKEVPIEKPKNVIPEVRRKPVIPENIPRNIQSDYDLAVMYSMDGGANPDINEIEDNRRN